MKALLRFFLEPLCGITGFFIGVAARIFVGQVIRPFIEGVETGWFSGRRFDEK